MKVNLTKRMFAMAIAFVMVVSVFTHTSVFADESNGNGYLTITTSYGDDDKDGYIGNYIPKLDDNYGYSYGYGYYYCDDDAELGIITDLDPGCEYAPLPDIEDLFPMTPEVELDEDGNAVVVHPEIPCDEDDECEYTYEDLYCDYGEDYLVDLPEVSVVQLHEAFVPVVQEFVPFLVDISTFSAPVIQVNSAEGLRDALLGGAATIVLENNIIVNHSISIRDNRTFILDTAGHTLSLNVSNPNIRPPIEDRTYAALLVEGSCLTITGGGTVNVKADTHIALDARVGGTVYVADDGTKLNLTNSGPVAGERRGIRALEGSTVTVRGDILVAGPATAHAEGATGIRSRGSTVTLYGNITVNGNHSIGIWVHEESNVVSVSGDVKATGDYSRVALNWRRPGAVDPRFARFAGPDTVTIGGQTIIPDTIANVATPQAPAAPTQVTHPATGGNDYTDTSSDDTTQEPSVAPAQQPVTVNITANDGSVDVRVRMSDNNAILNLPTLALNALVNSAENGVVTLDLSEIEDAESVSIHRNAIRRLAREGLGIEIVLPQGTIYLSAEVLNELAQIVRNSRVTVALVSDEDGAEVVITSNGRIITELEGTVAVDLP